MTPLHWACTEASIPHVALLLTKGHADIEAKDSSGCTPLLIAAQYGQVEVVAFLLQKGAQLLAVDKSGDTALHWASYKGSIPVCGLLGYYDNALTFAMVDQYGQTPLHLAALRGHTSVVRYILRQLGTTLNNTKSGKSSTFSSSSALSDVLFLKDKNGRTPLDLAIHKVKNDVEQPRPPPYQYLSATILVCPSFFHS
jgi:palmitoyltransferase ZDHHC13/17